jgi:hypothetical protein
MTSPAAFRQRTFILMERSSRLEVLKAVGRWEARLAPEARRDSRRWRAFWNLFHSGGISLFVYDVSSEHRFPLFRPALQARSSAKLNGNNLKSLKQFQEYISPESSIFAQKAGTFVQICRFRQDRCFDDP